MSTSNIRQGWLSGHDFGKKISSAIRINTVPTWKLRDHLDMKGKLPSENFHGLFYTSGCHNYDNQNIGETTNFKKKVKQPYMATGNKAWPRMPSLNTWNLQATKHAYSGPRKPCNLPAPGIRAHADNCTFDGTDRCYPNRSWACLAISHITHHYQDLWYAKSLLFFVFSFGIRREMHY